MLCQVSFAQGEEDILNSIGAELEAEADAKEKEAEIKKEYDGLKSKADGYYKSQKYDKAIPLYEEMSKLMPDNDYPKRQIRLIEQKVKEEKEAEIQAEYDKLIAEADALFGKEKWDDAKVKYQAAAKVKADESYPNEKIKSITKLIEEKKKAEEAAKIQAQYDAKMDAGEQALTAKKFEEAKTAFKQASKLKPTETAPKDKLIAVAQAEKEEAERLKKEAADKQYNDIIAQADQLLAKQQWDEAKAKYASAQKIKPEESYPKDKIAEADQLKAQAEQQAKEAALEKQYNDIIAKADNLLKLKNWDEAIAKYNEALAVKQDSYPSQKIKEAQEGKANEAAAAEQAKIDQQYQQVIGVADNLMTAKKYNEAIAKYNEAKGIKPSESYPAEQITKANQAIEDAEKAQEEAQKLEEYKALIKQADELLAATNFEEAITKYQAAKALNPNEPYPDKQIAKANELITAAENEAQAAALLEQQFTDAMQAGTAALTAKKYDEAISKFNSALEVKPSNLEASSALKEAQEQKKFAEAEAKKEAEEKAKAEAFEAQYEQTISEADAAKAAEDFVNAKALYKKASDMKPAETYPTQQIEAINQQIEAQKQAELQAKAEEEQAEAEKEAEYESLLTKGDEALANADFDAAISAYKAAGVIKPAASTPAEKIAEVERAKKLAEDEAAREEQAALAAEEAETAYQELLTQADQAFQTENWPNAINLYKQALAQKPEDEYPANQLTLIAAAQEEAEQAAQQAMLAEEAAKEQAEADFQKFMELGGQAAEAKNYNDAIDAYNKAAEIKPSANGPKDGIAEVNRLKELDAAAAAAEAKKEKQQLENQYSALMSQGEEALRNKQWDNARNFFTEASSLKPEAFGAKERIQEVDRLEELDRVEAEKTAQAERQAAEQQNEFDATLEMGKTAMGNENYQAAVSNFEKALEIIPSSGEARDLLRQAQGLMQEQQAEQAAAQAEAERIAAEEAARAAEEAAAKAKAEEEARLAAEAAAAKALAIEEQFTQALANGDDAMAAKKFKEAVEAYELAQELQPEAPEVASKLADAQAQYEVQKENRAEQRRIQEAQRRKEAEAARQKAAELAEQRRQERIKMLEENTPEALAKRYPSGITEETIDQGYRTIKRIIVVENGKGRQLHQIDYPWGLKFYYLNGKRVTPDTYKHNIEKSK